MIPLRILRWKVILIIQVGRMKSQGLYKRGQGVRVSIENMTMEIRGWSDSRKRPHRGI